ncbi:MAG: DEAD/DEAH box helicase [Bacteroidia bacterium]|nr:DEAD/DEAH box helicase [Bacteroidia bacterium]
MPLVDPAFPFRVVYSAYHHEYLGYLVSAHYVQLLPNGELSFIYQGAYPENLKTFASGLEPGDDELITLLDEITPKKVVKQFGGQPREEHAFFTQKFEGELKKLAFVYILRRLGKIIPRIPKDRFYTSANDGYPARTQVTITDDKASILFHFKRKEDFTRYHPTVKLRGELLSLQDDRPILLCEDPAWLLNGKEMFTFDEPVEGKRLLPFLRGKPFIVITRQQEHEYYQKFISQIVERYPVRAKGFQIVDIQEDPVFSFLVKDNKGKSFSFKREVSYGDFTFPIVADGQVKVFTEPEDGSYTFYRVIRDMNREKEMNAFFESFSPNPHSLAPWEYLEKETALAWLSEHTAKLTDAGIIIEQENSAGKINFDKPVVVMETIESGDWFDIQAIVKIGGFDIPFSKFRNHILRQKREFILPDGNIAILPDSWFADYRHLLEIAETREDGSMAVKRYQMSVIRFPSEAGKTQHTKLLETLQDHEQIPQIEAPAGLDATLRSYQAAGLSWLWFMKEHGMGGVLADDMGLGKTLQTLALLQKCKEEGSNSPSLVVMPTSLIQNWRNEAAKFTPSQRVYLHTGVNRSRDPGVFADADIILTTYGIVRQDIEVLKQFPFEYVILDESQSIKNPESKTSKAVRKLISKHRLSLTGTPVENTVMDIWSQMAFLNPGLLGSEAFFKKFYVMPIERSKDSKRSAKLRRIIYPYILRRRKDQVEKELPPRIEKLHYCEMTDNQQQLYEETRSTYRNYLLDLISQDTWRKNKLNILTGIQKLRQIAIHPQLVEKEDYKLKDSGKYLEMRRLLAEVISKPGSKVLIFSQFVKMLHILKEDLDKEGIVYNYLDGSTRDRQAQVDSFQADEDIRVFLISLKAGGVGLNLTAADYVFILDPWWNPAVENQAIDRSHRIGQQRTVFFYKFITQDSIEEKILKLQRDKSNLSDDLISVDEDIYKSLEAADLEGLFEL